MTLYYQTHFTKPNELEIICCMMKMNKKQFLFHSLKIRAEGRIPLRDGSYIFFCNDIKSYVIQNGKVLVHFIRVDLCKDIQFHLTPFWFVQTFEEF